MCLGRARRTPGTSRSLERAYAAPSGIGRYYDVAPDGQRFLMLQDAASSEPAQPFVVVLNFFQELNRLAPARRLRRPAYT